jgi:hypothetical protein
VELLLDPGVDADAPHLIDVSRSGPERQPVQDVSDSSIDWELEVETISGASRRRRQHQRRNDDETSRALHGRFLSRRSDYNQSNKGFINVALRAGVNLYS